MKKTSIIGIDIEDYYGNAIENIEFEQEIEMDLEEFSVRLENFSFSDTYEEDEEGTVARIQYEIDNGHGDIEEVSQTHSEIMDMLLENSDDQLFNEEEISGKILNALEIIILR